MPPMRWRGRLPRYRAPLLLLRKHNLPASLVGRQKRGEQHLRVLRAFESTNPSSITAPAAPLPSSNLAEPEPIDGWQAWWPSPPAAERQAYKIPDPPTIRRPVSADGFGSDPLGCLRGGRWRFLEPRNLRRLRFRGMEAEDGERGSPAEFRACRELRRRFHSPAYLRGSGDHGEKLGDRARDR